VLPGPGSSVTVGAGLSDRRMTGCGADAGDEKKKKKVSLPSEFADVCAGGITRRCMISSVRLRAFLRLVWASGCQLPQRLRYPSIPEPALIFFGRTRFAGKPVRYAGASAGFSEK